jgi:hypothetical protein
MAEFDRKERADVWRGEEWGLEEEQVGQMVDAEEYDWLLGELEEAGAALERVPEGVLDDLRGLLERVRSS